MADAAQILRAHRDDCLEILALQRLAYVQEAEIYRDFTIPPLRQTLPQLQEEFERSVVLKAVVKNAIVGSVRAAVQNRVCKIGRLIVHPAFQNQGIGRGLMLEIEKEFAEKPVDAFEIFTGERSAKNLAFYSRLGYEACRTEQLNDLVNLVFLQKKNSAPAR